MDSIVEELMAAHLRAEQLRAEARRTLVGAIRKGAAAGMTQREIAAAVGRSQPEVARLLRFHATTPRGRKLVKHRREVLSLAADHGFRNVRVFGSVARGEDGPNSDIDLLATFPDKMSLFAIGQVQVELGRLLEEKVDLAPEDSLRRPARDEILAEAVPL
ncbi:MAG: nucleotidyltransferase domain-containing protein [Demequinaceae bacterium]|nr:nucleotidyltransferase domain-containing protein [Demequinaceae bacterium]